MELNHGASTGASTLVKPVVQLNANALVKQACQRGAHHHTPGT
jgi:hypothetical protein